MTDSCGSDFHGLIRRGGVKCPTVHRERAPVLEGRGGCAAPQMFAAWPHACMNLDRPKA